MTLIPGQALVPVLARLYASLVCYVVVRIVPNNFPTLVFMGMILTFAPAFRVVLAGGDERAESEEG